MTSIALVTCRDYPRLYQDDQLLINPLKSQGFDPQPVVWDDESVDWKKYRAIIFRSSWDFYKDIGRFYSWLDKIEKWGISVWNPIDVIRWNIDKTRYLQDLHGRHIPIIPSIYLNKKAKVQLVNIMNEHDWDSIIVKPRFGGSGVGIFRTDINQTNEGQRQLEKLLENNDVIIQPYMEEIQGGEYSFIFIAGRFSHAILKKPKKGEFRVNYKFGGKWIRYEASDDFISQAIHVIDTVKSPLLYARVDMLNVNGKLVLNELELSDPMLFLKWHPQTAESLAVCFGKLIQRR